MGRRVAHPYHRRMGLAKPQSQERPGARLVEQTLNEGVFRLAGVAETIDSVGSLKGREQIVVIERCVDFARRRGLAGNHDQRRARPAEHHTVAADRAAFAPGRPRLVIHVPNYDDRRVVLPYRGGADRLDRFS
jgi:hypothetical protein